MARTGTSNGPVDSPPRQRRTPRAERSCDMCRRRKLRCVRDAQQDQCVLCAFHQRACTYLDERRQRRPRQRRQVATADEGVRTLPPDGELPTAVAMTADNRDRVDWDKDRGFARLRRTLGLHPTTHFKFIGPGSLHEDMLLDFIAPASRYHDHNKHNDPPEPDVSKFCRVAAGTTFLARADSTTPLGAADAEAAAADTAAVESLVRPHGPALVGLYLRIVHPSYPLLHKGVFLARYRRGCRAGGRHDLPAPLLAAVYLLAMDWWEYGHADDAAAVVGLGGGEPSANQFDAAPTVTAAAPTVAADATGTAHSPRPDAAALARLAMRALAAAVCRPRLSTVQACLLLLQRASAASDGDAWVRTSQVVALAEELGLHVDCAAWNVPAWEKGLRRRIAWAVFMQDKWSSLIYGRPSHVAASHWRIPPLTLADFDDDDDGDGVGGEDVVDVIDDGGGGDSNGGNSARDDTVTDDVDDDIVTTIPDSTLRPRRTTPATPDADVEKGRLLFIHLARLTEIMAEALATFYSHDPIQLAAFAAADGMQTIELVKPVALRLRAWATALPPCLRMEAAHPRRRLCSNGFLHLSYFVAEIMVYRCIVRSLARARQGSEAQPGPDGEMLPAGGPPVGAPQPPPALVQLCRDAAKTRLVHVMHFVEALRPEHLQAFWWFASAKSLAYIRTYISMLWATSQSAVEAELYRQTLDEFRWSLRVRARGVAFVTAALREMGDSLEDIDMSRPPYAARQLAARRAAQQGGSGGTGGAESGASINVSTSAVVFSGADSNASSGVISGAISDAASAGMAYGTDPGTSSDAVASGSWGLGAVDSMDAADAVEADDPLQATPEFLADFGVVASEAFFEDIHSLGLYS